MAKIISFPFKRPSAEIIRLFAGTVTSGPEAGAFKHFLEHDSEEGATIVWDGPGYEEARAAAREWQRDGLRLVDDARAAPTRSKP